VGLGGRGWLCPPQQGRLVAYLGNVLHGVVPVAPRPTDSSMGVGRRVTLVVTWWKASSQDSQLDNGRTEGAREADNGGAWLWEVAPRARCPQLIGCVNAPQWIHNFPRREQDGWGRNRPTVEALPDPISPVWTPINANSICLCTSSLQTSSVVEQDSQALVQQSSRDGSALDTNTALLSDAGLRFFLQTDRDFEKMYIPRDEQSES